MFGGTKCAAAVLAFNSFTTALGQKQTSDFDAVMSGFGGKADVEFASPNVRK